jgi:hypothetical protein
MCRWENVDALVQLSSEQTNHHMQAAGMRLLEIYLRVESARHKKDGRHDLEWWRGVFRRVHVAAANASSAENAAVEALACDAFSHVPEHLFAAFPVTLYHQSLDVRLWSAITAGQ